MSRPNSLAGAAQAAARVANQTHLLDNQPANHLLPPALKGIALGFAGGSIIIASMMLLGTPWTRLDETRELPKRGAERRAVDSHAPSEGARLAPVSSPRTR